MGTWYASALPVSTLTPPGRTADASLINWRVVRWTSVASFVLVAGVVSAVLLRDYRAQAAQRRSHAMALAQVQSPWEANRTHGEKSSEAATVDAETKVAQTAASPMVIYLPVPGNAEPPAPPASELPPSEQTIGDGAVPFDNLGTQVSFAPSPADAARQALKERKLLFTVHLAGNFEDCKFT
jgi:hypothetical protein